MSAEREGPPRPDLPQEKPKRGRPAKAKLTEDGIATAALELIDERGWAAFSMNALAVKLNVRTPSLYHHIEGQAELIDLVRIRIVRKIETASLAKLDWEQAIRVFGMSYYRAFVGHPNVIQILSVTPINDPETFQMYEAFLAALDREGWSGERALEILSGLEYLALGSAYEANASAAMLNAERARASNAPILARSILERAELVGESVEATFAQLLDDFITMFRLERERASQNHVPGENRSAVTR